MKLNLHPDLGPNVKAAIEALVETHGADILTVHENVDLQRIDRYNNADGTTESYSVFVNSEDVAEGGDLSKQRVLRKRTDEGDDVAFHISNDFQDEILSLNISRGGSLSDMGRVTKRMSKALNALIGGGRGATSAMRNFELLQRVRQYMRVMDEVFGFNSPEQLEMFITAWLARNSTTRLTGIPGTGKTTLIECASLMFANSYGFHPGQQWDIARTPEKIIEWEGKRFQEAAYLYPLIFGVHTISIPPAYIEKDPEKRSSRALDTLKTGALENFGGKLLPEYFSLVVEYATAGYILQIDSEGSPIVDENGVSSHSIRNTGQFRFDSGSEAKYAVHPIRRGLADEKHGGQTSLESVGDSGDKGTHIHQWAFEEITKRGDIREWVGRYWYDARVVSKRGRGLVDSEMRAEVGIAKVDKDKRAEQILYGVEITSLQRQMTTADGHPVEGSQYVFKPTPRQIVTQPVKFFNEVNRSQPSVEDAILGLIAEQEVEYRGEVFSSPNYVAWMDTNPHVGGNDLAFTDRIDIELMFPSAWLDQRYKILSAQNKQEVLKRGAMKPRDRVLEKILSGEVVPLRFSELEGVWGEVDEAVSWEAPGYNALMDIAIVSTLFSQRFAQHPQKADVNLDVDIGGEQTLTHDRSSGKYANSLLPLTSSGYFIDASITEVDSYRNGLENSTVFMSKGHAAPTLLRRVLAFRFTNSLAKFAKALAWLRGNVYVTRKEVMDVLPYVVGHRIGRAVGDGGKIETGLIEDVAKNFESGQQFVREAIVEGYINRSLDSFRSNRDKSGEGNQSRWVDWDSMVASARRELKMAKSYPEYERSMWAQAHMATDNGTESTGDPFPFLLYRLVLMEELTGDGDRILHPFTCVDEITGEEKDCAYEERVKFYQTRIVDLMGSANKKMNYSAHDIALLRRDIAAEPWLASEDKGAMMSQLDSLLDSIVGLQVPDNLGPSGSKLWGLYGACPDYLSDTLTVEQMFGPDPQSMIRTHSWYAGSKTARALDTLYMGKDNLLVDAYSKTRGKVDGLTKVPYPTIDKRLSQQGVTFQGPLDTTSGHLPDWVDDVFSQGFLNQVDEEFNIGVGYEMESLKKSKKKMSQSELIEFIKKKALEVQNKTDVKGKITRPYHFVFTCDNAPNTYAEPGSLPWSSAEDTLRLYISVFITRVGNDAYLEIHAALASAWLRVEGGVPTIVPIDDGSPARNNAGTQDGTAPASSLEDTVDAGKNTFFDAGNMTRDAIETFSNIVAGLRM